MKGSGKLILKWIPAQARRSGGRLHEGTGSQLLEFALALPFLAVLVIGATDFGTAFALRDKLSNAAREGARVAISWPDDLTQGSPPGSVQAVQQAVSTYLTNAGVTTCTLGSTATAGGYGTWSYSSSSSGCTGSPILVVERAYTFTANGNTVQGTRVTLNYPFSWSFGRVFKLLFPSSNYSGKLTLSTRAVMQNLS